MSRITLDFPAPAIYSHPVRLRISDINYGNHLGHDTLVSLLHDARCGWLAKHGLTELTVDGKSLGWVVAELVVNYRAEAFYDDELQVELAIGEIGSKGAEIYHRVVGKEGVEVAVAKVGVVFFDYIARKAAAVPENFIQLAKRP
ncbi:acyl-CoA thioesterase [Marinospirillum minutulum]|uniref:acyl-CoA thioesterase n=1 Tax=Marinospirillum minutulum TaxID=64974 RepID=UPI00041FD4B2|nr:acyl-CoA thioesterase [Marinospirillum minutulum]